MWPSSAAVLSFWWVHSHFSVAPSPSEPEWKRILREARARPPREENRRERNEEGRDDSEEDLPRSAFRSLVRDVL